MADLMRNDFLTLNHYNRLRLVSTWKDIDLFSLKYFGIQMNKSGGVVPKVLRFPSFKSLNCQPFPDFIDCHKSLLQAYVFSLLREIKTWSPNLVSKKNSCKFNTKFIVHKTWIEAKKFVYRGGGEVIDTHTVCKIAWLSVGRRESSGYWLHLACSGRDQCFYIRNKGGFVSKNQPDCHKSERETKSKKMKRKTKK